MNESVLVRAQFDPTSDRSTSIAIVEALALVTTRQWELSPLADYVDTDSLDALFSPSFGSPPATELRLSFPYEDWQVTVSGSGEIAISARPDTELVTD